MECKNERGNIGMMYFEIPESILEREKQKGNGKISYKKDKYKPKVSHKGSENKPRSQGMFQLQIGNAKWTVIFNM